MAGTRALRVDPSNLAQLEAWDGDEGTSWAENAERLDRGLARYHRLLLKAAAIATTATVLDVGCGSGQVTRAAARRASSGSALGVDLSRAMIGLARREAAREGLGNVSFEQADAQVEPFPDAAFDVAVSRTGTMFFGDPVAAFANIGRALCPGARLVQLVWQPAARNEWIVAISTALAAGRELPPPPPDAPGPFSLGDPARVRTVLSAAGFTDVHCEGLSEPMCFGSDTDEAERFILGVAGWMLDGLDEAGRARARADLRRTVEEHRSAGGVEFGSAAWLVSAVRP